MTDIVISRRGLGPVTVTPSSLRLTPASFGVQDRQSIERGRISASPGWRLVSPAPLAWFAHPDVARMDLDAPATFTLELEHRDGRTASWTRSFNVRLDLRTTFDPEQHAFPERNSARVIGEVDPRRDVFDETYAFLPRPLGNLLFKELYSDIVQLRVEGEHRGGLCSGMARWAGLRSLRRETTLPEQDEAIRQISLLHGRQLTDRALLSSLRWFLRASPSAAYEAIRDDALFAGRTVRALDIGVPKPWRRDIARAVVREGHTIVPFHIRQESPRLAYIDCYDPNRARETHTIELHLDTNRYSYRNKVSLDDGGVGIIAVPHGVYSRPGTAFLATAGSLLWRIFKLGR
jgi:hypothetical protein